MQVDFDGIVSEVRSRSGTRTALTFHSIGDTDCVSSALALARAFPNSVICTPDRLTANAERVLKKFGFDAGAITQEFPEDAETVVLVDVNNFEGCGRFAAALWAFAGRVLVVDHHRFYEDRKNMAAFSSESYNSAASISYDILKALKLGLDRNLAKLLALGILSDSAEFKNTTPETFVQLGELLAIAGTDYISLMTESGHISPAEERAKTVADVMKSAAFVRNGLLFMHGECHAYANLAADDAIRIGADVALFHSIGKEVAFSARLRPTLDRKYGIHLGKMMKELSPLIGGTGGGHPCAAGAYGSEISNAREFDERFVSAVLERVTR